MAVIQKRADELKPGDVLPENGAYHRRMVVDVVPSSVSPGRTCVRSYAKTTAALDSLTLDPADMIDVESNDLTSAQQHAEELADLVRDGLSPRDWKRPEPWDYYARALLDKIKPPEPPTLAEALEVLIRWQNSYGTHGEIQTRKDTDNLIECARRAKLI